MLYKRYYVELCDLLKCSEIILENFGNVISFVGYKGREKK